MILVFNIGVAKWRRARGYALRIDCVKHINKMLIKSKKYQQTTGNIIFIVRRLKKNDHL